MVRRFPKIVRVYLGACFKRNIWYSVILQVYSIFQTEFDAKYVTRIIQIWITSKYRMIQVRWVFMRKMWVHSWAQFRVQAVDKAQIGSGRPPGRLLYNRKSIWVPFLHFCFSPSQFAIQEPAPQPDRPMVLLAVRIGMSDINRNPSVAEILLLNLTMFRMRLLFLWIKTKKSLAAKAEFFHREADISKCKYHYWRMQSCFREFGSTSSGSHADLLDHTQCSMVYHVRGPSW